MLGSAKAGISVARIDEAGATDCDACADWPTHRGQSLRTSASKFNGIVQRDAADLTPAAIALGLANGSALILDAYAVGAIGRRGAAAPGGRDAGRRLTKSQGG